ncbi:hypothetical protein MMC26_000653 [Xylographa opegraphella]|nr:hypothetical protein [Xylographa opegraphella]
MTVLSDEARTEADRELEQPPHQTESNESQTASEFIDSQLRLEADAREALPYSFEHCTYPLGPLRQSLFSCLTCNPPPASVSDPYTPAGVCYACSIACHGEHILVELFNKRNFTCDCGTTRLPATAPCTLRIDPRTGTKGPVHSQSPAPGNNYNQNFRNRFCGCGELYDPVKQEGTMYQCLGLATEVEGGCDEDWWHPECLLGLPRDWHTLGHKVTHIEKKTASGQSLEESLESDTDKNHPIPPGFPDEDQIEAIICYKCIATSPWVKRYVNSEGFKSLRHANGGQHKNHSLPIKAGAGAGAGADFTSTVSEVKVEERSEVMAVSKKRKADDNDLVSGSSSPKKVKNEVNDTIAEPTEPSTCRSAILPPPPPGYISLVACDEDFRSRLCRCPNCYPSLSKYPQLLEEEEIYEPPLSEDGENAEGGGSVGTGSLLDRGEAALSNVDRVRAIEGVMVYNHLKDKVKSFLQPFAESGQAVGAEDIKAYFEKLRGDAEAIRAAGGAALAGTGDMEGGDNRREESGY